jgi:pimeloyl-ACP methyl ester carboxylesterase
VTHLYIPEYDATVRWLDIGSGAPVLLLPGLSMPVAPGFAAIAADPALAGRRCIMLDYLGSGQSDHPTGFDYALASHAEVIVRVLTHLGLGPVDMVGHSMGGTVGIQLALDHPDLVRRLVVAEGNVDPGGGMMSQRVSRDGEAAFLTAGYDHLLWSLRSKARDGAGGADRLVAGWQQADPVGLYANAKALVDLPDDYLDRFAAGPAEKHFVFGANSLGPEPTPDTPRPERLEALGITPHVIPDAGHAMMLDNHAGFVAVLAKVLEER